MNAIIERIARLKPAEPQGIGELMIIPLVGPSGDQPPYRLLDGQTLARVQVSEISEAGSVPELLVENPLDVRLFIMDGQELIGARQNRILNTDVLVPAGVNLRIPVSCVEAGRWHYTSRSFSPGRAASYRVRSGKHSRVYARLKETGRHDADQGEVWREVDQSLEATGSRSDSRALHDAYLAREQELAGFRESLRLPEEAVGVAVFEGPRFCGLDVFDRHETLKYYWDSLIDSYTLEWRPRERNQSADIAAAARQALEGILTKVGAAPWEAFSSPGDGREFRFRSPELTGSALVWEDRVVIHMTVFPAAAAAADDRSRTSTTAAPPTYRPRIHRRRGPWGGGEPIR